MVQVTPTSVIFSHPKEKEFWNIFIKLKIPIAEFYAFSTLFRLDIERGTHSIQHYSSANHSQLLAPGKGNMGADSHSSHFHSAAHKDALRTTGTQTHFTTPREQEPCLGECCTQGLAGADHQGDYPEHRFPCTPGSQPSSRTWEAPALLGGLCIVGSSSCCERGYSGMGTSVSPLDLLSMPSNLCEQPICSVPHLSGSSARISSLFPLLLPVTGARGQQKQKYNGFVPEISPFGQEVPLEQAALPFTRVQRSL